MGLFDEIVGAIANPNQQANADQLSSILGAVQQVAGNTGIDPATSQTVTSMVGGYVRSALQQKQATGGTEQAEQIVNQFSGLGANAAAVGALFSQEQQAQIANAIAQRTGLSQAQVMGALAMLVPVILKMLQSGSNSQGNGGGNNVLGTFLDSDQDGDVDIADALGMAGQFLSRR
ncbi:MAG: DUF937 domain-containing protein [Leptolyngbyaceae cyanobacterium bins.302]|nr:DUF937 domain-containing protein [Leptolyngbyaceae cyanobacterium bins.302]